MATPFCRDHRPEFHVLMTRIDNEGWWAVVHDWEGKLVYEGPTPVPEELVTVTVEDLQAGRLFTFDLSPLDG